MLLSARISFLQVPFWLFSISHQSEDLTWTLTEALTHLWFEVRIEVALNVSSIHCFLLWVWEHIWSFDFSSCVLHTVWQCPNHQFYPGDNEPLLWVCEFLFAFQRTFQFKHIMMDQMMIFTQWVLQILIRDLALVFQQFLPYPLPWILISKQ